MLAIIGCGNLNRQDDGVGVRIIQRLQAWLCDHPCARVRVFDAGTAGMDVMFQARGARSLTIVDACVSGSEPGAVFRLSGDQVVNRPEPSYSLHDFRWDHALYAGRRIFQQEFPADVTVYLVEASVTGMGLELSRPVLNAVDTVSRYLQADIEAYKRDAAGQPASSPNPSHHVPESC